MADQQEPTSGGPGIRTRLKHLLPILSLWPRYNRSWLRADLAAGLTSWAVAVPSAMAYAGIAGVPPLFGVYSVPLPLIAYALLGTSPVLAVGPDSATALISFHVIAYLAVAGSPNFLTLTAALTMLAGGIFLLAGILRCGWLANFISIPVMRGFVQGLVWVTIVGQIPKLLGQSGNSGNFFARTWAVAAQHGQINGVTALVGLSSVVLLLVLKRWFPRIPRSLAVAALAILVVSLLGLDQHHGVAVVGHVDPGLPALHVPQVGWSQWSVLAPGAAAIALLGFTESLGAAQAFGRQSGGDVNANQELLSLGAANLGSAVCGGFVAVGSLSKTIVAQQAGAKTQVYALIEAVFVVLTLLFLMPLFEKLPQATLAAVVIASMLGLADFAYLKRLYSISFAEFCEATAALLGVLVLGVLPGVGLGVGLAAIALTYRSSYPGTAVLGKMPGHDVYRDIARHPEAETTPGLLVFRFDSSPFFANATHLEKQLMCALRAAHPAARAVIVDCESMNMIDSTAMEMLTAVHAELANRHAALYFARVKDPVRDSMRRSGLEAAVGSDHFFDTIGEAAKACAERA